MITGLGELMRQSEWACSPDSNLTLQSLIDMADVISPSDLEGYSFVYESRNVLLSVKDLINEQNVDLCAR